MPPNRKRSNRKRPVRARTVPLKKISKIDTKLWSKVYPQHARPDHRKDCKAALRPCPYVGCKHHLYLDVNEATGSIKLNFPDIDVWEMAHTCVLDIVEKGKEHTLEEVGEYMNLTRERIRQLELIIREKLFKNREFMDMEESALEWLAAKSDHHYGMVTNGRK